jgi:hypothetical protein
MEECAVTKKSNAGTRLVLAIALVRSLEVDLDDPRTRDLCTDARMTLENALSLLGPNETLQHSRRK